MNENVATPGGDQKSLVFVAFAMLAGGIGLIGLAFSNHPEALDVSRTRGVPDAVVTAVEQLDRVEHGGGLSRGANGGGSTAVYRISYRFDTPQGPQDGSDVMDYADAALIIPRIGMTGPLGSPIGSTVKVSYDPADPANNGISAALPNRTFLTPLLVGLAVAAMGALMVLGWRIDRRRAAQAIDGRPD